MKRIQLFITIICLCYISSVFAEETIYYQYGNPHLYRDLYLTPISRESNIALSNEKMNVKFISGRLSDVCVRSDGLIFISKSNGRILDLTQNDARLDESLMTPETDNSAGYSISLDGKWIIKILYNYELELAEFQFIEFSSREIANTYEFKEGGSIILSNDANTFVSTRSTNTNLYLVERIDGKLQSEVVNNTFGGPFISFSGDRVFTVIELEDESRRHVVIEKNDAGWSEPEYLTLYDQDLSELQYEDIWVIDIANNGRTLFIETKDGRLALVNEKDGSWGLPEYLDIEKQSPHTNDFSISEDGNVILFESFRKEYGFYEYFDLFLYIKQDNGEWKKQKLNPDGVDASRGAILTKDGSKVYWVPWQTLSSVEYEMYR